ncbi:MAG TPA: NAD(P)-binding domain-containing protein, partial [Jatrophihabitans sp.]
MPAGPRVSTFDFDVVVVGGGGHVGLPLAIAFADRGLRVGIYDVNEHAVKTIAAGELPFRENGATEVLQRVLAAGRLQATVDPSLVSRGEHIVVVIGTPVDEHLNPDPHAVPLALQECKQHFRPGQLLVLRSTVYPGVTRQVEKLLAAEGVDIEVAFCPERIAEGKAMQELFELPQIVSARSAPALARAGALFGHLTE